MDRPERRATRSDARHVDVLSAEGLHYWTLNLGVSAEVLRGAVSQVGTLASEVRAELRHRRSAAAVRSIKIFIFAPSLKHPHWWVLLPGAEQLNCPSENAAVAFALEKARPLRQSGRPVEILQERMTGTWMRVYGFTDA
jgi:hypothetical protein